MFAGEQSTLLLLGALAGPQQESAFSRVSLPAAGPLGLWALSSFPAAPDAGPLQLGRQAQVWCEVNVTCRLPAGSVHLRVGSVNAFQKVGQQIQTPELWDAL